MNTITEPLRALVRRKLWPVALLLVGALVAVPVLLSKQPEASAVTPVASPAAAKSDGLPATFVSAAEPADDAPSKRRRTLGAEKDPFEPAPLPKPKKAKKAAAHKKAATAAKATTSKPETKPASSSGGTSASTPSATPTPTPTPKTIIPAGSLQIRFGSTDQDPLPSRTLKKSSALPSADEPAFVYDGLADDNKTAVFMLTGEVTAEGDGQCLPTPENCETLKLKAGETEFLTVAGADANAAAVQYELDILKVHTKPFAVAAKVQ